MKMLIFVYNEDSAILSKIKRAYNEEYVNCKLYAVIRGRLFMKRVWKQFLKNLAYKKVHLYRSKFRKTYPQYTYLELPSVLIKDDIGLNILVNASEINQLEDAEDCVGLLGQKLAYITTSSSHID